MGAKGRAEGKEKKQKKGSQKKRVLLDNTRFNGNHAVRNLALNHDFGVARTLQLAAIEP